MEKPPFKLATAIAADVALAHAPGRYAAVGCGCAEPGCAHEARAPAAVPARARLGELDVNLHCSVIGTCLSTGELRKLMARFLFVRDSSDLDIHHEAVSHSSQGGPVTKALQKLLDQRHEAILRRFAAARDAQALGALWDEALQQGEVPGAYWALLTHRQATPALRQRAFGDVHMLSHLVGAANRADVRRLVALEQQNSSLRERAERQQLRAQALLDERDREIAGLAQQLAQATSASVAATASGAAPAVGAAAGWAESAIDELAAALSLVALQTERRERAEQAAGAAADDAARLREELAHLGRHAVALSRELLAAETQLREIAADPTAPSRALATHLQGRRIFYVGGRPSSTPAIRDLVLRHGGEFQHHGGGQEDRKGLIAAGVAWAELVVFPVDCVDHDSAGNLKRLCARHRVPYLPLRGASVASFAAALAQPAGDDAGANDSPGCTKHA